MTIEEAREFFAGTDFSAETKEKIEAILSAATTLGHFEIFEIKRLMQEELDKDFAEAGVDISQNGEAQAAQAVYTAAMKNVESGFEDDVAFVETEIDALDQIRKKVAAVSDGLAANAIKNSI